MGVSGEVQKMGVLTHISPTSLPPRTSTPPRTSSQLTTTSPPPSRTLPPPVSFNPHPPPLSSEPHNHHQQLSTLSSHVPKLVGTPSPHLQPLVTIRPHQQPSQATSPRKDLRGFSHQRPQTLPSPQREFKGATSPQGESRGFTSPQGEPREATSPQGEPRGATSLQRESRRATSPQGASRGAPSTHGEPRGATSPESRSRGATSPQGEPRGATSPHGEPRGATSPLVKPQRGVTSPQGESREVTSLQQHHVSASSPNQRHTGTHSPHLRPLASLSPVYASFPPTSALPTLLMPRYGGSLSPRAQRPNALTDSVSQYPESSRYPDFSSASALQSAEVLPSIRETNTNHLAPLTNLNRTAMDSTSTQILTNPGGQVLLRQLQDDVRNPALNSSDSSSTQRLFKERSKNVSKNTHSEDHPKESQKMESQRMDSQRMASHRMDRAPVPPSTLAFTLRIATSTNQDSSPLSDTEDLGCSDSTTTTTHESPLIHTTHLTTTATTTSSETNRKQPPPPPQQQHTFPTTLYLPTSTDEGEAAGDQSHRRHTTSPTTISITTTPTTTTTPFSTTTTTTIATTEAATTTTTLSTSWGRSGRRRGRPDYDPMRRRAPKRLLTRNHRSTTSQDPSVCDSNPCGEPACHPSPSKDRDFQCFCFNGIEVEPNTECPRDPFIVPPQSSGQHNPSEVKNPYNLTGTVVAVSVLVMVIMIFGYWRRKSIYALLRPLQTEKKPSPQSPGSVAKSSSLLTYNLASNPNYYAASPDTQPLHTLSVHLIHPEQISFTGELGEGCFGKVYKGTYGPRCPENGGIRVTLEGEDDDDEEGDEGRLRAGALEGSGGGGGGGVEGEVSTTVAVKVLKESAGVEAEVDFMREVEIMSAFTHKNILSLIGIVAKGTGGTPWMVFEYMPYGDLAEVLRSCNKDTRPASTPVANLTQDDLLHISVQIASGMEYLSSQHFVHRDLACRNCLVGENLAVKISDFGMSRDVYTCDYYKVGGSRMLPVRWMALESIKYGKFTLESDVWSFGVVLWEIYSFGTQPYYGNSNENVVNLIFQGILLSPPDTCPPQVCDVMRRCWATEPVDRLKFPDILGRLERLQQEQKLRRTSPSPPPVLVPPVTYSELCLHDEGGPQLDADQYLVPRKLESREYITVLSDV